MKRTTGRAYQPIRIYRDLITTWEAHRYDDIRHEWSYRDLDPVTGEVIAEGSEDFSARREHDYMTAAFIWTWDGVHRQRGGRKFWDRRRFVRFHTGDGGRIKKLAALWYPEATEIKLDY